MQASVILFQYTTARPNSRSRRSSRVQISRVLIYVAQVSWPEYTLGVWRMEFGASPTTDPRNSRGDLVLRLF